MGLDGTIFLDWLASTGGDAWAGKSCGEGGSGVSGMMTR